MHTGTALHFLSHSLETKKEVTSTSVFLYLSLCVPARVCVYKLVLCYVYMYLLDVPKQPTCMNGRYRELHQQLQSRAGKTGREPART